MYSTEWFDAFAAHRPAASERAELEAITAHIPRKDYPRVLDGGCGIGRIAGPLATRGYAVTGVDISVAALSTAQVRAPGPRYVAIDQRHIGRMRWAFDAVLVIWNSLGFVDRPADLETVAGARQGVHRPVKRHSELRRCRRVCTGDPPRTDSDAFIDRVVHLDWTSDGDVSVALERYGFFEVSRPKVVEI